MTTTETAGVGAFTAHVCDCGQDLDGCSREHCPRCGCQVHRAA